MRKSSYYKPRAFTVVEILLVLALFGIVAGLFVYNFDSFKETFFENRSPENLLTTAVKKARLYASSKHEMCVLLFEPEKGCFKIQTLTGKMCESFSLSNNDKSVSKTAVTFFDAQEKDSIDFGWAPNRECKQIFFDPTGLFGHVFVKIQEKGETKNYRIDAFSGQLVAAKL